MKIPFKNPKLGLKDNEINAFFPFERTLCSKDEA
jgi:hypothetical protein